MRTTLRLPDDLLREVKRFATETDRSLTRVIEDALREALARRGKGQAHRALSLPTHGRGGLQPGVDLDDTAALLELMESGHGSARRDYPLMLRSLSSRAAADT